MNRLIATTAALLGLALPSPAIASAPRTAKKVTVSRAPASARQQAQQTLAELQKRTPRTSAHWSISQPGPHVVAGMRVLTKGKTYEARARHFLRAHEALLGGVKQRDLRLDRVSVAHGRRVARFAQSHAGTPVLGRFVAVSMTPDGVVLHLSSDAVPVNGVKRGALSSQLAVRKALLAAGGTGWAVKHVTRVIDAQFGGAVDGFAVDLIGGLKPQLLRVVVASSDGRIVRMGDRMKR
ncbi:MAG: hypothetical protein KC502_10355 [Myxococcales bacterium]|nr:hypothetical protein [Myxococcales bacterium]